MDIENINNIKNIAKEIALNTLLYKRVFKDPANPLEYRVIYTVALQDAMMCLTEAVGSGALTYMNNSTRAQEILDNFLDKTNETGSFEWLTQSTADWLIRSFKDEDDYNEWVEHLTWSYKLINPVNKKHFSTKHIAIDSDTCGRLPDDEFKYFLLNNSYITFLYTLELSFNEILSLVTQAKDLLDD